MTSEPSPTSGPVLVTGALGLVGSAVVPQIAGEERRVVATDLDVPANRKKASRLTATPGVAIRWCDLTDSSAVEALLRGVQPSAIVHLAAIIPPLCYARRAVARKVIVDATGTLVRAASALPSPPRFVLASSIAVYGARNPHRSTEPLTAETPVNPSDLYGALKVEAEAAVTASDLDWVILRLGGVLPATPWRDFDVDMMHFEATLPADGRLQTVDVRDVACAFSAATTTTSSREVFLVGGDDSHRALQGNLGAAIAGAMGLVNGIPPGRPGNPDSDRDWFATDWMNTSRAQEVLAFQHHTFGDLLAEIRAQAGWRRWLLRAAAPFARAYMRRTSPYRHVPGPYADLWGAVARIWGDPSPDPSPDDGARPEEALS